MAGPFPLVNPALKWLALPRSAPDSPAGSRHLGNPPLLLLGLGEIVGTADCLFQANAARRALNYLTPSIRTAKAAAAARFSTPSLA
jgi:hypothetical protein